MHSFPNQNNKIASSNTLWSDAGTDHSPTFWHALKVLVDKGMLEVIPDDFGPPLYKKTDSFNAQWTELQKQSNTPAFKYNLDPKGEVWLVSAVQAVNKALKEQSIKSEDFTKPDAEWEPLPVERTNPKLQKTTEELEKTIKAAEADNGYAANLPEEKTFVVENLKHEAAAGHRVTSHFDDTAVGARSFETHLPAGIFDGAAQFSFEIGRVLAALREIAEILGIVRPPREEGVRQLEHLLEIAVPRGEACFGVEHDDPVAHIVESDAQLGLSLPQSLIGVLLS